MHEYGGNEKTSIGRVVSCWAYMQADPGSNPGRVVLFPLCTLYVCKPREVG